MTHAWTNAGGDACDNISDLVLRTGRGAGTVLLGDFNVHRRGDAAKFAKLNEIMQQGAAAKDSWTLVHGVNACDRSATDDEVNNKLAAFFSPMRNTGTPDCIDYIYLGDSPQTTLRPFRAEVLRDWKYDTAPDSEKWYWVHEGSVGALPSATTFGRDRDKLCVVVKTTDHRLQVAMLDRATGRWTHSILKQDGADIVAHGAPTIVWFYDTLHLFYQQHGNVLKLESTDGVSWTRGQEQGFRTSAGLCAVVYRDVLHVFARDPTGNQVCYHTWDHPQRGRWSERRWARIETETSMSAAVLGDVMCLVTKDGGGSTGGLMHTVLTDLDGGWSPPAQVGGDITSGSPGITAHNGRFEIFYRERDGGGIFHRSSPDGRQWSNVDFAHHATNDEVCPVSWGDTVLMFFSFVVHESRKRLPGKLSYPEDCVLYPERALAHGQWPVDVALDASDHYPYQVDLVFQPTA